MENAANETESQLKALDETHRAIFNILEDAEEEKNILGNTQKAVINILEDSIDEKTVLKNTQNAVLNILDDYSIEKKSAEDTQKAVINILEDSIDEKTMLKNTQNAVLNILDDYSIEKKLAEDTQKAVINILEDSTDEKTVLKNTQSAVLNILVDFSVEKKSAEDTQKAVINILEDFSVEKERVEKMNIKLISSNKEIEQFAYIASHDLQEPLRTIANYVALFLKQYKGKLDEDADQYLLFINGATGRMQLLIKDLMDYSRIGKDTNKTAIDCNVLLKDVLNDMAAAILESKAEIHVGPLPVVTGFLAGLTSLFQNLISNAIKFQKKDIPPIITISAQTKDKEWLFAVKDNGIGIDKTYYHKLFVIFQRLHNKEEYSGTGIGLAQSKKIVELHGGIIWVESELEKGSTFYFTLPKTKTR